MLSQYLGIRIGFLHELQNLRLYFVEFIESFLAFSIKPRFVDRFGLGKMVLQASYEVAFFVGLAV